MKALLLALLLPGCAGFSGPLFDPHAAWNPQKPDIGAPCPYFLPYRDVSSTPDHVVCTTRPDDPLFEDMDTLPLP